MNKTYFEIQTLTLSDLNLLFNIFTQSIRKIASKDYTHFQIQAWINIPAAQWQAKLLTLITWVAKINTVPVGFISLDRPNHIDMLYIHPDHQCKGIATQLLSTLEQSIITRSISTLTTDASLTAKPFFEKRGFTTITQQQARRHGQDLTNFKMSKDFNPKKLNKNCISL
ncbi:GNAT family N-acetyltransferase [Commensalibacter oyaizuii]|uniref:GNAT family N-acetyltransferase n=1 Tax=Commensalibacter oyaizuii TaxID=3043873 RepID=A0ABT6Q1X8_9PROT|nr:GNAT family N-acetyltransferase [Commensalibacter sp. TBRC 16381]MDI2091107.1 GNAT family N-acetyltransferase [Commensalibacter sp. TBRC 16381]